jgi:hypothetical protein
MEEQYTLSPRSSTPTFDVARPKGALTTRSCTGVPHNPALWCVGMNSMISEHPALIRSSVSDAGTYRARQLYLEALDPH